MERKRKMEGEELKRKRWMKFRERRREVEEEWKEGGKKRKQKLEKENPSLLKH